MSEMLKILKCCGNVTHLSLPALDDSNSRKPDEELKEALQKMEHLTSLSVHCYGSFLPYITLIVPLKELTIHSAVIYPSFSTLLKYYPKANSKESGFKGSIEKWVANGFSPQNLNIIVDSSSQYEGQAYCRKFLLASWARWNYSV